MSFFTNLRADKLVTEIRSATDPASPARQKAVERLKEMGPGAIEPIFAALPEADKNATQAFVEVLTALVSHKTFPQFVRGLIEGSPRVISGITWALTNNRSYPHTLLLEALATPGISKPAILEVIAAQKARFGVRELLSAAYAQEPNEKAALFRVIGEIADQSSLPELLGRVQGKDPIARVHIINTLARFNTPEVQTALQGLLKDPNKLIRGATLSALQRMDGPIDVERVCALLRDPEIDVLNRAIDVVIKANHPETMRYLIEVLKDENENARRAAVEVLNEVGNAAVGQVPARVAQGQRLVGAQPRRRRARQDRRPEGDRRGAAAGARQGRGHPPRRDRDPQPDQGRACGRLAHPGDPRQRLVGERARDRCARRDRQQARRAAPDGNAADAGERQGDCRSWCARSASSATAKLVDTLLPLMARPEREIRIEAIQALSKVADESRADQVRNELQAQVASPDQTISRMAAAAVSELDNRIAGIIPLGSGDRRHREHHAAGSARGAAAPGAHARAHQDGADLRRRRPREGRQGGAGRQPARHPDPQAGRHPRGALQVHRPHRPRCLRHRAADGGHGRRRAPHPQVPEPERVAGRGGDEALRARAALLAQDHAQERHPHLRLPLHPGQLYAISMEYFPSHTLGGEIVNEKPIELKRAVQFGIDICTGMTVAHQVGIVHRDLKPANVLINQEGLLKIVDFGVAAAQREGDTQLTKTGYVIGSPKYMAPEQILGKKVDERADIYALGVMLYEMLTGVPPYSRGDHMSVMYQHVQGKARARRGGQPGAAARAVATWS